MLRNKTTHPRPLTALLDSVEKLTLAADAAILPHFRTLDAVENKQSAGFDPVTVADRAAEKAIRAVVTELFPSDGIIGEEFGETNPDADYVWVIDPIDGTRAFMMGLPTWGTLIGLTYRGSAVFGIMHQSHLCETFVGWNGAARWRRTDEETDLSVRPCGGLGEAILSCTTPEMFQAEQLQSFNALAAQLRMTRFGTDCYGYAMLSAGLCDLVVESGLQSYDITALIPIIRGAGGFVSTWDGKAPENAGSIIAAGDERVFEAARALLTGQ